MSLLTQDEVYEEVANARAAGRKIAVATIVTTSGSTPQRTGAKLLVYDDGRMKGTVGGGCVEADVWAEAREALIEQKTRLCKFTLRDDPDAPPDEEGMVCGGEMEVFICHPQMLNAHEISSFIKRALGEGRSAAIVSVLEPVSDAGRPARLLIEELATSFTGTLGDQELDQLAIKFAHKLIEDDKQEIVVKSIAELTETAGGEFDKEILNERLSGFRLLFELSRPPLELIICGGGHVGQAVAKAGRFLDFNVTVIDDRADFASREKFPDPSVRLIAGDFVESLRSLRLTPASHVVIVTRGHRHDEICLSEVIDKPARYLGMIGSRRRTTTIRERLRRNGVTAALLHRIHAPIGLDIGAQTPEEIATAIMSEIILVRRGGTGAPKSADGPMTRAK